MLENIKKDYKEVVNCMIMISDILVKDTTTSKTKDSVKEFLADIQSDYDNLSSDDIISVYDSAVKMHNQIRNFISSHKRFPSSLESVKRYMTKLSTFCVSIFGTLTSEYFALKQAERDKESAAFDAEVEEAYQHIVLDYDWLVSHKSEANLVAFKKKYIEVFDKNYNFLEDVVTSIINDYPVMRINWLSDSDIPRLLLACKNIGIKQFSLRENNSNFCTLLHDLIERGCVVSFSAMDTKYDGKPHWCIVSINE